MPNLSGRLFANSTRSALPVSRLRVRALRSSSLVTGALVSLPVLVGACQGHGGGHGHQPGSEGSAGAPGTGASGQAFVVAYDIPQGHTARELAVVGQQSVTLHEAARVEADGEAFGAIANTGSEPLELKKDAESGAATSVGDLLVGPGAGVHGDATSAGSVAAGSGSSAGTIDGATTEDAEIALTRIERTVTFPGTMAPAKRVPAEEAAPEETLAPGYYAALLVKEQGRVTLPSGDYYFDQLRVGEQGTLVLDDAAGPINLYVRQKLDFDGTWEHAGEGVARLTLVYLGESDVKLADPFEGTLLAPGANLKLIAPAGAAQPEPEREEHGGHWGFWPWRGRHDGRRAGGEPHGSGSWGWGSWGRDHDHDHDDRYRGRRRGHDHDHHHGHGHGHDQDGDPSQVREPAYVGAFVGRSVSIGAGVTVLHQPSPPEAGPAGGGRFVTFEFPLPGGVSPGEIDIGSIAGTDIGGGVIIDHGCDPGTSLVTSSAQGPLSVGGGSQLSNIVSVGSVRLSSGTTLSGAVSSAGGISALGAEIGGTQQAHATLGTTRTLRWDVTFPGGALPELQLAAGRARVLYPEVYGPVTVAAGATLYLRSGEYYFESLSALAGASVVLDSAGGPVVLNVRDELRLEGNVSGLGGVQPQLFVAYAGSRTALVSGAFDGSLVAPRARISVLGGEHRGQFLGRTVNVASGVKLHQCGAEWDYILGTPLVEPVRISFGPSPVFLSASGEGDNTQSAPGFTQFQIPDLFPVTRGNAGNGTAVFSFSTPGGERVSCTYRGGASVAHPETLLEVAKGREFLFERCSNGALAGSSATGSDFSLDVQGDPQGPGGSAAIAQGLGDGCDEALRAPISPARSIEMLQSFSWASAPAVAETNEDGTPTLYYANIYLRNEVERELLDRFLIHYSGKPFFDDELEALYKGKCGPLDLSGDGNGLFVFAILPGKTYNRIRAAVTNDDIRPEERVMFQAIVLREPPEALKNANGSLDYEYLKEAGYYYLGLRELPADGALDHTALPGGAAKAFIDAIEFVATVARDVGRGVIDVLGEIDRFAQGEVTVRLDIDVRSRVPAFAGGPLLRGWGPEAGREAGLRGVRVEIRQWAQRLYTLGIPVPTAFHAHTNRDGAVSVRVAKGGGGIGGATSARGDSGLCVDMENNSAKVTHFLLANTVCDFRALDLTSINSGATGRSVFGGFERDVEASLSTSAYDMAVLSEATNTFDYVREVVGTKLRPARILTGSYATLLSGGKNIPWAPCFGFPNTVADTAFLATLGIPIVGTITNVLTTSDIVVPPAAHIERDFGVMTHEYGHFTLCGLMDIYAEDRHAAFSALIKDVALEGATPQPQDHSRVIHESFADFIAGQVMGGADYIPLRQAIFTGGMSFCNDTGNDCWDRNFFSQANGTEAISRVGTLLHDAFDGHAKFALAPTNGDIWTGNAAGMTLATAGYGDARDEEVRLGGPRLNDFVDAFLFENVRQSIEDNGHPDHSFRMSSLEEALGEVVLLEHSWCQACDMFLPHTQSVAGLNQLQRWEACRDDERVRSAIGSPPSADVRMDVRDCRVCLPDEVSGSTGICRRCAATEFVSGNTCVACGPGSVPVGGGCAACGVNQISIGNRCVECPLGKGPDRSRNVCVDCAIDASLDWSTMADPACSSATLSQIDAPGDVCPDQFWVEVINLNGVSSDGRSSDFWVAVDLATDIEERLQCLSTDVQGTLAGITAGGTTFELSSVSSTEPSYCDPAAGGFFCIDGRCVHDANLSLSSAEVSAGRTSVQIMGKAVGLSGTLPVAVNVATTACINEPPPR